MQPSSAATAPGRHGPGPGSAPVLPESLVLRRCHRASSLAVLGGLVIDASLVFLPLTAALVPLLPQVGRLALTVISLATLVLVLAGHALRGRSLGGLILGLRGVDVDAGLPPASLRAVLAVLRLGSTRDVVIISTRGGPDPTRGTLADLERASTTAPPPATTGDPEAAYGPPPPHPHGQQAPAPISRPISAPLPTATRPPAPPSRPVAPVPQPARPPAASAQPETPTPTTGRPPSLPPSIPAQRSRPPAPGTGSALAQPRTPPRQPSDTVELQPVRADSARSQPGGSPPAPPPPPAPSSRQAL